MSMRWKHEYIITKIDVLKFLRKTVGYFGTWPMQELTGTTALADNVALALGRDLVINGDFATDTVWTKSDAALTIGGGSANWSGAQTGNADLNQLGILKVGKSFKVTYTISGRTAGTLRVFIGGAGDTTKSADGTYTATIVATSNTNLLLRGNLDFDGSVDNVVVQQTGILDSGAYPGAEELTTTGASGTATAANWTPVNNAALTNPSTGILKVARDGTNNPNADQVAITVGQRYLITGEARSDGNAEPRITDVTNILFIGTTSTSWQEVKVEFVAATTSLRLFSITSTGTEYTEWRNISVTPANPLNGDYVGVSLAQTGAGNIPYMVSFDGATSYLDIYSAELNSAFNPSAGTLIAFGRVFNAGVWIDGVARELVHLGVDAANEVKFRRPTNDNTINMIYRVGGITEQVAITGITTTGTFMLTLTWDTAADGGNGEVKAYFGATQVGATQAIAGTWVGNLATTLCVVGAAITTPTNVWHGYLAYPTLYTVALPQTTIAQINATFGVA